MLIWIILGIFFLLSCLGIIINKNVKKLDDAPWTCLALWGFLLCLLMSFFGTIKATYDVASDNELIKQIQNDIIVLDEQYNQRKNVIMEYIEKYPMEENFLMKLDPKILLNMPEIKSNIVLNNSLEKLLEIEQKKYDKKIELNEINKWLRVYNRYRFFCPT